MIHYLTKHSKVISVNGKLHIW